MSDLGSRGNGSAKDRRTRLYQALVNRNTGEVRRPNQLNALGGLLKAGSGAEFRRNRRTGKYEAQVILPF